MILWAQMLLRLKQLDLDYAIQNNKNQKGQIESCYEIAERYWSSVKVKLVSFKFLTKEDEIFFFKKIKPAFTSDIEYFKLMYNLEVLAPPDQYLDKFLSLEKKRLSRFILRNAEFYSYYKSDRSDLDEIYFLRINNTSVQRSYLRPYDNERLAKTSHDHLVASILALEKYDRHLNGET
jgi:hypothetical protein